MEQIKFIREEDWEEGRRLERKNGEMVEFEHNRNQELKE